MRVRVIKRCFYKNRLQDPFNKDGTHNYLDIPLKEGQKLPSWAVSANEPVPEKEESVQDEPTTIHEIAKKSKSNIARPGKRYGNKGRDI